MADDIASSLRTSDVSFPCWWSQQEGKRKEEDAQAGGEMKLIFGEDIEEEEEEVFGKGKKIDYVKEEEGEKKERGSALFPFGRQLQD